MEVGKYAYRPLLPMHCNFSCSLTFRVATNTCALSCQLPKVKLLFMFCASLSPKGRSCQLEINKTMDSIMIKPKSWPLRFICPPHMVAISIPPFRS